MERADKMNTLLNELRRVTEKYGLRWVGTAFDFEDNIRTIIISDNEVDREYLLEEVCEVNAGFEGMVANKYEEGDLN